VHERSVAVVVARLSMKSPKSVDEVVALGEEAGVKATLARIEREIAATSTDY
jgi:hypothetical protein